MERDANILVFLFIGKLLTHRRNVAELLDDPAAEGGGIAIQIKSVNDKDGQVYSGPVPGKAGDVFTLSVMAKGSGEGRLELMLYDKNNRYAGMLKSVNFKVSKEMVKYTKAFTVPAQSGKEVAFVRVAFLTVKGGDIYYQNAKLDKK